MMSTHEQSSTNQSVAILAVHGVGNHRPNDIKRLLDRLLPTQFRSNADEIDWNFGIPHPLRVDELDPFSVSAINRALINAAFIDFGGAAAPRGRACSKMSSLVSHIDRLLLALYFSVATPIPLVLFVAAALYWLRMLGFSSARFRSSFKGDVALYLGVVALCSLAVFLSGLGWHVVRPTKTTKRSILASLLISARRSALILVVHFFSAMSLAFPFGWIRRLLLRNAFVVAFIPVIMIVVLGVFDLLWLVLGLGHIKIRESPEEILSLGLWLYYAAAVCTIIAFGLWFSLYPMGHITKVTLDIFRYVGDPLFRARAHEIVKSKIISSNIANKHLVIAAHSLGSIIVIDLMTHEPSLFSPVRSLTFVSLGSPLARLFCSFFPNQYPSPKTVVTVLERQIPRLRWLNIYRPLDYVGARLGFEEQNCKSDPVSAEDISTNQYLRFHVGYFADPAVYKIVFDRIRKNKCSAMTQGVDGVEHSIIPSDAPTMFHIDGAQSFTPRLMKTVAISSAVATFFTLGGYLAFLQPLRAHHFALKTIADITRHGDSALGTAYVKETWHKNPGGAGDAYIYDSRIVFEAQPGSRQVDSMRAVHLDEKALFCADPRPEYEQPEFIGVRLAKVRAVRITYDTRNPERFYLPDFSEQFSPFESTWDVVVLLWFMAVPVLPALYAMSLVQVGQLSYSAKEMVREFIVGAS